MSVEMSELTEEQKKRVEENRRKALEKRAAAKAKQQTSLGVNPIQPCSAVPSSHSAFNLQNVPSKPICSNSGVYTLNQSRSTSVSSTPRTLSSSSSVGPLTNPLNTDICVDVKTTSFELKSFYSRTANASYKSQVVPAATSSRFNKSGGNCMYSAGQTKQRTGSFVLLARKRFLVDVGYHAQMIDIFKTIPSKTYDAKAKKWNFSIEDHDKLVGKLKVLQPDVVFSPLPRQVVKLFLGVSDVKEVADNDLSSLDPVLLTALMPFQKVGVNFGINLGGKVLIADDMGLGKTIQAIGIANYYRNDWPLLVVTPSSVRYSWAEAFNTWLPSFASEVTIINAGKDHITNSKIVLLSYDLLTKKKEEILRRGFKSVIMDESHFLKNHKSARTKAAQQVMKQMKRIIMLSGTPALSRPVELFSQISALNSKLFPNFMDFGIRYCNGNKAVWGWDFSGSSHMEELHLLLEETVMIRRLKSDVIKQLPSKIRQVIILDTFRVATKNKVLMAMSKKMSVAGLNCAERRGVLLQYFHETGVTKLPSICEYIRDLLEAGQKFLCFAHHQVVLDGICKTVEDLKVKYIRIQGSTPSEQRKILCDKFQLNDSCKVAVLSITAANAGITLTAAHLVVFAELFWNPGILTQAEDRAHRIGQEDSVVVQYLVAKGTADDEIWPLVQRKLDILNKAGLSKDNFINSETVSHDSSAQTHIEDFWKELDFTCTIDLKVEDDSETNPIKRPKLS